MVYGSLKIMSKLYLKLVISPGNVICYLHTRPYTVWACLIAETREVSERVEHTKRCMGSGKSWPVLSGKSKYKCPESKSAKSIFLPKWRF